MKFHAYIINLKHATERWELVRSNLEVRGISFTRIEGVYGDRLPDQIEEFNERKYNVLHGKTANKREIGCYLSHIKALRTFIESGDEYGLILEDDITLPENIAELLESTLPYAAHWDLLRLTALKQGKYLDVASLPSGYSLSYNIKVLKNTGAYLINRHAAQCCLKKMLPMFLPYDVALDREWHYGFKTACITPLPVILNEELPGQIPSVKKIPFYRATTFKLFHLITHIERHLHRTRLYRAAMKKMESKS